MNDFEIARGFFGRIDIAALALHGLPDDLAKVLTAHIRQKVLETIMARKNNPALAAAIADYLIEEIFSRRAEFATTETATSQ